MILPCDLEIMYLGGLQGPKRIHTKMTPHKIHSSVIITTRDVIKAIANNCE